MPFVLPRCGREGGRAETESRLCMNVCGSTQMYVYDSLYKHWMHPHMCECAQTPSSTQHWPR